MGQLLPNVIFWAVGATVGFLVANYVYGLRLAALRRQLDSWRAEDKEHFKRLRFKLKLVEPAEGDVSLPSQQGPRHRV